MSNTSPERKESSVLFPLGLVKISPQVLEKVSNRTIQMFLNRHASGDFGDLPALEIPETIRAILSGSDFVLSLFSIQRPGKKNPVRIEIYTSWNRTRTTVTLAY